MLRLERELETGNTLGTGTAGDDSARAIPAHEDSSLAPQRVVERQSEARRDGADDQRLHEGAGVDGEADAQGEEWRPVVGYESIYEISSFGRARRSPNAARVACGTAIPGRVLTAWPDHHGYLSVKLWKGGKKKHFKIHQLVAAAFIGPCLPGFEVNHRFGIILDNRPSQLEYTTHAGNQKHASLTGLMATGERHGSRTRPDRVPRGEKNGTAKLTDESVRAIRVLRAEGLTYQAIGKRFGVCIETVRGIWLNRKWTHVA